MNTISNIRYGKAPAGNVLDLHVPPSPGTPVPVIAWSGGSGWMRDDGKDSAATVAPFFIERGYAVAGVSVRSSGQATFPAQLEDALAAVAWLREHASEHGLDPDRIATMGNSSGGWFAVMAGLCSDGAVGAVVDLYGPTDFLQMDAHMPDGGTEFNAYLGLDSGHVDPRSPESLLLGGPIEERPEECARANPVARVGAGAPPMLILHGQADPYVPHHQSELLFAAATAHGNPATFYSIPNTGHEHGFLSQPALAAGYVVRETSVGVERDAEDAPPPTWEMVEDFIAATLAR
jgi:acetyl esterase/lipase